MRILLFLILSLEAFCLSSKRLLSIEERVQRKSEHLYFQRSVAELMHTLKISQQIPISELSSLCVKGNTQFLILDSKMEDHKHIYEISSVFFQSQWEYQEDFMAMLRYHELNELNELSSKGFPSIIGTTIDVQTILRFFSLSREVKEIEEQYFDSVGANWGRGGDAFRHLLYSLLLSEEHGETRVARFMAAHEKASLDFDSLLDRYNNDIARLVYKEYAGKKLSREDWIKISLDKVFDAGLISINLTSNSLEKNFCRRLDFLLWVPYYLQQTSF